MRTPAAVDEASSEQTAILREDHREVMEALAALQDRRREAIVLRLWLDLRNARSRRPWGLRRHRQIARQPRDAELTRALKSLTAQEDQA